MKKIFLLAVVIFIVNISFAQFDTNTMFNDTLRPFGDGAYTFKTICQDDSFYYVTGAFYNNTIHNRNQFIVIKYNKNNQIIKKTIYKDSISKINNYPYNSTIVKNDRIITCLQIVDTALVVKGMVIAFDKHTLDTLWTKIYPHPDTANIITNADKFSDITAIKSTPDNNYILAGNYMRAGSARSYLMKIDSLGNVIWTKVYSTISSLYDVEVAPNGGYMLIRKYWGAYAVLTDSIGNILWQKNINSFYVNSTVADMTYAGNNSFIGIVKYVTNNNTSNPDYGLNIFKINIQTQQLEWNKTYQLYKSLECITLHQAMGVETLPDGSIIVSGTLTKYGGDRLGFILKLNSNGDSLWTKTYHFGSPIYDDSQLNDILLCDDGGFMGVGFFSSEWANVNDAAWMFKTDSNGVVGWETPKAKGKSGNIKVWPNPAINYVNIEFAEKLGQDAELKVYNTLGQVVLRKLLNEGQKKISIELDDLNSGIYLFEVLGDKKVLGVGKFVVE